MMMFNFLFEELPVRGKVYVVREWRLRWYAVPLCQQNRFAEYGGCFSAL